jgi:signal recognition particle subunit SRP54
MAKGQFDMNDLRAQLRQMQRMGGLGALAGMMPGMKKAKAGDGAVGHGRQGAAAHGRDHRFDDAEGAQPSPNCSMPSARSASPMARAPRCRTSTSCSRCTRKWPRDEADPKMGGLKGLGALFGKGGMDLGGMMGGGGGMPGGAGWRGFPACRRGLTISQEIMV